MSSMSTNTATSLVQGSRKQRHTGSVSLHSALHSTRQKICSTTRFTLMTKRKTANIFFKSSIYGIHPFKLSEICLCGNELCSCSWLNMRRVDNMVRALSGAGGGPLDETAQRRLVEPHSNRQPSKSKSSSTHRPPRPK